MLYFGSIANGAITIPYLIDAHGSNSLHIISLTDFAKNALLYGSAFFANGIVLSTGIKRSLLVYGACQVVCWLICIPMYVYGKRARSFVSTSCFICCGYRLILNVLFTDRASSQSFPRRPPRHRLFPIWGRVGDWIEELSEAESLQSACLDSRFISSAARSLLPMTTTT